jgi:hypothetical protein
MILLLVLLKMEEFSQLFRRRDFLGKNTTVVFQLMPFDIA